MDRVLVRVAAEGLCAESWVNASVGRGPHGLTDFFAEMHRDWRGWTGTRRWSSIDSDLELVAHHDGRIRISVALSGDGWSVKADLLVEPAEELTAAVAGLKDLSAA